MICLDQMGPVAAKSFPGAAWVPSEAGPGQGPVRRAVQEVDYGRRGKGYAFGAFEPATGAALTATCPRRTAVNWVAFLEEVEAWIPAEVERVYAILDNLTMHRATDVLLFSLQHPRSRVRLSADLCCLSPPDRAVVESAALASTQGAAL